MTVKNNSGSTRRKKIAREKAWHSQGGLCFYCCWPITLQKAKAEHSVPQSKGGRARHIVASCNACDQRKGTMSVEEFLQSEGYMQILKGRGLFHSFKPLRGWRRRQRESKCRISSSSPA